VTALNDDGFEVPGISIAALNKGSGPDSVAGNDLLPVPDIAVGIVAPVMDEFAAFEDEKFEIPWCTRISFVRALDERTGTVRLGRG